MLLNTFKLQKDYSLICSGYQLKLPLNIETIIPSDDSVRLLSQLVEEMADVLMYYNDVLWCFGITEKELKESYLAKYERNLHRW